MKFDLIFRQETLEELFPSRPAPESLGDFLAVIDEVAVFEDSDHLFKADNLARQIFGSHETLLQEFVAEREDLTTLLIKIFSGSDRNIALVSTVIEKWFRRDETDPLLRFLCTSYRFPWMKKPLRDDSRNLAIQLRDSPNPRINRLFMLFEKQRHRVASGQRGKSPKVDLDYDPHEKYDDDDGGYDDDDDGELAAFTSAMGKMSPAELRKTLNEILSGDYPGSSPKRRL